MVLCASALLALSAAPVFAVETTLTCTVDTFISNAGPNTNYDAAGYVGLGIVGADKYRTLLRFDLSGIPSKIVGAKLRVYYYDGYASPTGAVQVYRVKRAWSETQATWNNAASGSVWQMPGAMGLDDIAPDPLAQVVAPAAYPTWFELDLDALTVDRMRSGYYPNEGFLMRGDWDESPALLTHLYRGRTEVNGPELVVTYQDEVLPTVTTPASSTWSQTLAAVIGIGCIVAFEPLRRLVVGNGSEAAHR